MLSLEIFQPNALRQGVFEAFPPGAILFNWFFYGKRMFDLASHRYILAVKQYTQFYERDSGKTFEVKGTTGGKFLILDAPTLSADDFKNCRRHGYVGYVHVRRDVGVPMYPPFSKCISVVAFPAKMQLVGDWARIKLFRYVRRELKFATRDRQPELVKAHGVARATKIIHDEVSKK